MVTRFGQSVKTMLYNGGVKDDNKKAIIEEFKSSDNSQSKILLLSIQCGVVGFDFPLVNDAYDFTYSFVPAEIEQARYRIARVGHARIKVIRSLNFGTIFEDHLTIIKEVKEALTNFLFCPNEERGQLENYLWNISRPNGSSNYFSSIKTTAKPKRIWPGSFCLS